MRSIALQCCCCVMTWLSVRTVEASETTPLPLPTDSTESFSMGMGIWRVLFALAIVVAIVFIIRWLANRANVGGISGAKSSQNIKIIERKPIGPRQTLLLVQVCEKKVLLHQAKGALTPLCEIEESEGEDCT